MHDHDDDPHRLLACCFTAALVGCQPGPQVADTDDDTTAASSTAASTGGPQEPTTTAGTAETGDPPGGEGAVCVETSGPGHLKIKRSVPSLSISDGSIEGYKLANYKGPCTVLDGETSEEDDEDLATQKIELTCEDFGDGAPRSLTVSWDPEVTPSNPVQLAPGDEIEIDYVSIETTGPETEAGAYPMKFWWIEARRSADQSLVVLQMSEWSLGPLVDFPFADPAPFDIELVPRWCEETRPSDQCDINVTEYPELRVTSGGQQESIQGTGSRTFVGDETLQVGFVGLRSFALPLKCHDLHGLARVFITPPS